MPAPPSRPATRAVLPRLAAAVNGRTGRRVVVALNVLVLLVAVAPFAIWEGFGPDRFASVDLGGSPDIIDLEPGDPLATPQAGGGQDGWDPSSLPYDLSPTTTVTLVYSVGSTGLAPDEAERLRVHDVDDRGGDGLTDTMMLVLADGDTREVALLSLPRDLWLHDRGHRINATRNLVSVQAFVSDVSRMSGLPIHHLVELNFGAFARMIDEIGGVAVSVDRPLADVPSVLYVPEAGCWRFDGATALAWARSRHTLTQDEDGDWVTDRTASDFGRIERQQALLGALWDRVRSPGTIGSLPGLFGVARDGLVVDDGLGIQQVRDLLSVFSEVAAGTVEGHTMPTTGQRIEGNAAQVVAVDEATELLTRLRSWPPDPDDAPSDSPASSAPTATPQPSTPTPTPTASTPSTLPDDTACGRATARDLPDPRPALGGIVARNGGGIATTGDGDATGPGSTDEDSRGGEDPATTDTPAPSPEPNEPAPTEPPDDSGDPTPEPTPSESSPTPSETMTVPVPLPTDD